MSYLKAKAGIPYELMLYTDVEALRSYLRENVVDLLICNDLNFLQECSQWKVSRILMLSEERIMDGANESGIYHPVFKYQSTENIIHEMLGYCVAGENDMQSTTQSRNGSVIVVYSPVGKCYKTTLALAMADALGKKGNVLYLNLEDYTGLRGMLCGEGRKHGTLSDIMYMYRRANTGITEMVKDITCRVGHFQIIPPVEYPEDVSDILPEEWRTFVEFLMNQIGYDYCVIDMGNLIIKPWELFQNANIILMPIAGDEMEQCKIEEFENVMINMGKASLLDKIEKLSIAHDEELSNKKIAIERIEWSLVGRLARKVVSERRL